MSMYKAHCGTSWGGTVERDQLVDKRLDDMPYAQAGIQHFNNADWLVSYITHVARITKDGWLYVGGLYSMTTRKHISAFLREMKRNYCFRSDLATFATAKRCVEEGIEINLWNGDTRKPIEE